MSPTRLLFEGPDIHAVLAQVRGEYGTDVRIVGADKVRSGGIGGFFSRERFEVAVEIDLDQVAEPSESPESPEPIVASIDKPARDLGTLIVSAPGHPPVIEDSPELPPSFLLSLIESVDAHEEAQFTRPEPEPVVLKAKAAALPKKGGFQSVLDDLVRAVEETPVARPTPEMAPEMASEIPPASVRRAATLPSRSAFLAVGLPPALVPDRRQALSTYDALLGSLAEAAAAPELPAAAGEVIAVVGRGGAVVAVAELVVAALGGERAPIELVASRTAEHAEGPLRMSGPGDARRRAARLARRDTPTVVAIDREHDVDGSWTAEVLKALDVSAVCAVVDATAKPRDLESYVRSIGRVEALAVTGCAHTVDPATVLALGLPVISVDGRESSAQVWAAMLAGLIADGEPA